MTVVFAASEAAPFVKTGGLADVAAALPEALAGDGGHEVLLFLPYYGRIKQNPAISAEFVGYFYTDLAWRHQYVGLYRVSTGLERETVYLIDNEQYFGRSGGLYGWGDDGERFAFFSKAILDALVYLDVLPDILHLNDWQTALVPIFLHAGYREKLGRAKTVFTIHNIEYQGVAHPYFLGDGLGLGPEYENTLTYHGNLNFLKGAILSSDAVTTVSRTYAQEIRHPYFAHGLSSVIEQHAFKIRGIVNGIDVARFNPAADSALAQVYTSEDLSGKAACKRALQRRLGLPERPERPIVGMVSRLVKHKGLDLIVRAAEELMRRDMTLIVLGTGEERYEQFFRSLAARYPDRLSVHLDFSQELASQIYAGADLYLMPSRSEPCGLSQLIAMRYGAVPIVHAIGGLRDTVPAYQPQTGEGYGFTFQSYDPGDLIHALDRALKLWYEDTSAWAGLMRNGMTADLSWRRPMAEYIELYQQLITPNMQGESDNYAKPAIVTQENQ